MSAKPDKIEPEEEYKEPSEEPFDFQKAEEDASTDSDDGQEDAEE